MAKVRTGETPLHDAVKKVYPTLRPFPQQSLGKAGQEEPFWEYWERFSQSLGRANDSRNDALRVSLGAVKSGLFGSNYPP